MFTDLTCDSDWDTQEFLACCLAAYRDTINPDPAGYYSGAATAFALRGSAIMQILTRKLKGLVLRGPCCGDFGIPDAPIAKTVKSFTPTSITVTWENDWVFPPDKELSTANYPSPLHLQVALIAYLLENWELALEARQA